jgi:branched-chain amino acid transport system substrate-binding protein
MKKRYALAALPALIALMFSANVAAQIKVGVNVSATGAGASLGIPEKNTFALLPKEIGGKKSNTLFLTMLLTRRRVKNARKLVSEDKVDLLIGSTIVPTSLAMIDVAAETETPMISMAAAASIISPSDAKRHWIFKTPQNDSHMSTAVISHMADAGIKTVGFIGFNDAYGEGWYKEFSKLAELRKIKIGKRTLCPSGYVGHRTNPENYRQ